MLPSLVNAGRESNKKNFNKIFTTMEGWGELIKFIIYFS
jgi:hypothetical protein